MIIEITRQHDDFNRVTYHFMLLDRNLRTFDVVLDTYTEEKRATKRHKYTSVAVYNRLRVNGYYNTISRADITIPEDVKQEVLTTIMQRITFSEG